MTAAWTEAGRGTTPLRPFGTRGEESTIEQLEDALQSPRRPPALASERVRSWAAKDAADLEPELRRRAAERQVEVARDLAARGEAEATSLRRLLEDQRDRIAGAEAQPDDPQMTLFPDAEAAQRRRDRRHWRTKLDAIRKEIEVEPERVRKSYEVRADRVEIVGLVYLWPGSN